MTSPGTLTTSRREALSSPFEPPLRRVPRLALALVVAAGVTLLGYLAEATSAVGAEDPALGPGVVTINLDVTYSRFSEEHVRVRSGTVVRFIVTNQDPIHHELIVGPSSVHRQHEHGTELAHPPVPGEVSVAPHETGMTFYRFDEPGPVTFACHLPGHVAYGMTGVVEVIE